MPMDTPHLTWTPPVVVFLMLLPVPLWGLEMQFVPTSISVSLGEDVTIPCNFHKKPNEDVTVFWFRDGISNETYRMVELESNTQNLTIANVNKTDRGFYQCRVNVGNRNHLSCGTYLRVKGPPLYLFFNVSEATKNRLITAEGIILLLCAIIPGTFLLYRRCRHAEVYKRLWEAYSTAGKAINNDYTSLTGVQLLSVDPARTTM
ncbi:B-cell antigen receptor complex-associated protein alpha chain isoform X2 [Hyla sarda]|uniref:B-cell antigen receptor complex-associated protein alpha chain isoform X2 n=1 Tax=Hyla sarda TaxID=327740 RepID=UPI0024C28D46|nr:B-cell antigen receptor complex-associated protein alpha chain isoform X2 [Hyla sarda]